MQLQLTSKTMKIETAALDADNVPEIVALINQFKPDLVMNIALPYQDLTIMDACLETGVHYLRHS
jgi:saccharopine dehydrogenase (NAD+, L-lysine-forming)